MKNLFEFLSKFIYAAIALAFLFTYTVTLSYSEPIEAVRFISALLTVVFLLVSLVGIVGYITLFIKEHKKNNSL